MAITSDNYKFTAVFEPVEVYYDVMFDSQGGSAVATQKIKSGDPAVRPVAPQKDGTTTKYYTFRGWSTKALELEAYDFSTPVTGNITLYAHWTENEIKPTVVGGGGGGTVVKEVEKEVVKEVEVVKQTGPTISERVRATLETGEHIWYIRGYEDGTVRPDGSITRAEVATIFYRLLKNKNVAVTQNKFSDISGGEWYATAVQTLTELGILTGYTDGTFKPEQHITRAEFAAVASRFDELKSGIDGVFSDVSASHWAYKYVMSAYSLGWISGYPGDLFLPENAITRAEVVAIVNRMLGRRLRAEDVTDKELYPDLSETHWGFAGMIEASVAHKYEWQPGEWERWLAK